MTKRDEAWARYEMTTKKQDEAVKSGNMEMAERYRKLADRYHAEAFEGLD